MVIRRLLPAAIVGLFFAANCLAGAPAATQPSAADMQQKIDALQQQVGSLNLEMQQLKNQSSAAPSNAAAQNQPASQAPLPDELVAQSPTTQPSAAEPQPRADALAVDVTFDTHKGLWFTSENGDFAIHPFTLLQIRNTTNLRQHAPTNDQYDAQNGFEIRRMQLGAEGNAFTPDLTFRIFIQTERSGGEAELFDAWLKYHFHDTPFYIEGGQFKSPFAHEQMIYDRTMMAADRTLTDDILSDGEAFSQGVMGIYQTDDVRAKLQFTNGYGTNDVNFEDPPSRTGFFGIGTRDELKLMGKWSDYDQFTSLGNTKNLMVAGIGFDNTQNSPGNTLHGTADLQWNNGPLGLYGSYVGRYTSQNGAAGDTYDYGPMVQASYLFDPNHLELFARYDYLKLDGNEFAAGTNTNIDEITAGMNYYFYGQNLKLTTDATYLPNGSPVDDNGSGVLVSSGGSEWVFRVQVQFAL
jgi:outer membrane murein-binding lipoprotein Lpp